MTQSIVPVTAGKQELDAWTPDVAKERLARLDVLAAYAVKVKDVALMQQAALKKAEDVQRVTDWWASNVQPEGTNRFTNSGNVHVTATDAEDVLGYTKMSISRWMKALEDGPTEYIAQMIEAMKRKAGLTEPAPKSIDASGSTPTRKEITDQEVVDGILASRTTESARNIGQLLIEATQPEVEEFTTPLRNMRKKDEPMPVKVIVEPNTFETADLGKAGPEFAALNAANYARRAAEKKARDDESF